MGKLLDKYMAKYMEAVGCQPVPAGSMRVKPEVWISCMWEIENGLEGPWQPEHRKKLNNASTIDPEFGRTLLKGLELRMEMQKAMEAQKK